MDNAKNMLIAHQLQEKDSSVLEILTYEIQDSEKKCKDGKYIGEIPPIM